MRLQFGLDAYQHRAKSIAAQRLVNCYLEREPDESRNPIALLGAYGIDSFSTPGAGPLRGGTIVNGVPYVVSGQQLYSINAAGTGTLLGTIPNSDQVSMAGDGTNLMVVTQGAGYVWNGTAVNQITDPDFPGAAAVAYFDGYFVIVDPDTGKFYISALFAPINWDALDFASAEASPDNILGLLVEKRELFLFGVDSTEPWWNSGNADFPLERVASGYMEVGIISKFAHTKADNSVFFVGSDGKIYRLEGYTPIRVSSHAVEQAIEDYADKSCTGMTWVEGGHTMIGFRFATGTWAYDASTQRWHERRSYNKAYWRPLFFLRAFNKWLVGDVDSNKLGQLSPTVYTEYGDPQVMIATATAPRSERPRDFYGPLELVFETGVGLTSGQGSDPQVMLRRSNDGGRTWGNEHTRGMGAIGQYERRATWSRNGSCTNERVYEFSISDPVRRALSYATAQVY